MSILGLHNTCHPHWLHVPSENGSKNSHSPTQSGKFSLTTSPKRRRDGQIKPSEAIETIERVAVMMGCKPLGQELRCFESPTSHDCGHQSHQLTSPSSPEKAAAQSAPIPSSNSPLDDSDHVSFDTLHHDSIHLFQGLRIIQTRMMVLAAIHGLRPNPRLKSILEGCTDPTHLWGSTLHAHNLFSRPFLQPQSVYIRFTHIVNMQPKFYIGSAMHRTLDREYSRSRKYLQLTNERLVQAELALRYWREHDNLYIWTPIPIYT